MTEALEFELGAEGRQRGGEVFPAGDACPECSVALAHHPPVYTCLQMYDLSG